MDWEGKIGAAQFTCAASGLVLQPGETFYSGLLVSEAGYSRQDYSAGQWPALDRAPFVSWWKHKVPNPGIQRRPFRLNAETLAQIFANLHESQDRLEQCLAYVVGLALVRARKMLFVEVRQEGDATVLILQERANERLHRLRDPHMSSDEQQQVLDSLLAVTEPASDGPAASTETSAPAAGS